MSDEIFETLYTDWLVPFLLVGLRERDSDRHELTQRMADLGFGASPPEAIDRALWRMEGEGIIASERDGLGERPPRRRFSITASGAAYLDSWASALSRYQEEIALFFRTYAGRPVRGVRG